MTIKKLLELGRIEAVKEAIRTFLVGMVTVLGSILTMINVQTGVIAINWGIISALILFSAITAVLKGLEKYLYEVKSDNPVTSFLKFEGDN